MSLGYELVEHEQGVVIKLRGRVGFEETQEFERIARTALAMNPAVLVVELSGVSILTTAGIGELLRLQARMREQKGKLHLAAVPASIAAVLQVSTLDSVFSIHADAAEALASR